MADPYFSNVQLLLHFDGADGSTTFTDVKGHTVTPSGNAQIDTAISKFGGASGLFDGSGDNLSVSTPADFVFGTGDFTVEAWVYVTTPGNLYQPVFNTGGNNADGYFQISDSKLRVATPGGYVLAGTTNLTANTWYHVAWCRASGTMRLFLNGVQDASGTGTPNFTASSINIGVATNAYAGNIDDLRVTVGVARYTANFTPPTEAFPDFADITPTAGVLTHTGGTPTVEIVAGSQNVTPTAGILTHTGGTPTVSQETTLTPTAGILTHTGGTPTVDQFVLAQGAIDSMFVLDKYTTVYWSANGAYSLPAMSSEAGSLHGSYAIDVIALREGAIDGEYRLDHYEEAFGWADSGYAMDAYRIVRWALTDQYALDALTAVAGAISSAYGLDAYHSVAGSLIGAYAVETMRAMQGGLHGTYAVDVLRSIMGGVQGGYALGAYSNATGFSDSSYSISVYKTVQGGANGGYELLAYQSKAGSLHGGYTLDAFQEALGGMVGAYRLVALEEVAGSLQGAYVLDSNGIISVFAINLRTGAVSRHENLVLSAFASNGVRGFGGGRGGLYQLGGSMDDGDPIHAFIETGQSDLGSPNLKRLTDAYLGIRNDGRMKLTVDTDDGTQVDYTITEKGSTIDTRKIDLERGQKGRYFRWKLENQAGADFEMDDLKIIADVLNRRK